MSCRTSVSYRLDELSFLLQGPFILDLVTSCPRFDGVAHALELLAFFLKVVDQLISLGGIGGVFIFLVLLVKSFDPDRDVLKTFIDLLLDLAIRHGID